LPVKEYRKQSVTQAQAMEDADAVKPLLKKTSSPAELTLQ
jgi:hypothetical protein